MKRLRIDACLKFVTTMNQNRILLFIGSGIDESRAIFVSDAYKCCSPGMRAIAGKAAGVTAVPKTFKD